jgi:PEP-CTERM motif
METQIANRENRKLTSTMNHLALTAALLWILVMSTSAWAQPATAGILQGTSPDGGTVRITIKLTNGTLRSFTVQVAPGANSAAVMAALATKIDGDPNFSASATSFTIGSGIDKQTVNSVNVISLGGAIDTISVNPDDSGFKDYGSTSGTSNEHSYLLLPHGSVLPGQVNFSAVLGDSNAILADVNVSVANGTGVSTILGDLSSQLATDGVNNQVNGDILTVDTAVGQTFLIGGSASSQGLTSIAYDQSIIGGLATPEPSSLLLLGSGAVGLCAFLRKRLLTRN